MGVRQSKPRMMLLIAVRFGMMLLIVGSFAWLGPNRWEGNNSFGCCSFWGFWLWKCRIGDDGYDHFVFVFVLVFC
jgi:hypothetical protein